MSNWANDSSSPPTATYSRATAAASETVALPRELNGGWITIQAETLPVWVRLGTVSTISADRTTVSTLTALSVAEGGGSRINPVPDGAWQIPAGGALDYDLRNLAPNARPRRIFMAHISTGAGGFVRIKKSSGPRDGSVDTDNP